MREIACRWFVKRVLSIDLRAHDFGADKLNATQAPMFFIHGDADGARLDHIAEMYRLKGGEIHGDLRPRSASRSASRLAILPDTTHVTLMERREIIVPMINSFFGCEAVAAFVRTRRVDAVWERMLEWSIGKLVLRSDLVCS